MLFSIIGTQKDFTEAGVIAKYWGEKIGSVTHPKYNYHCDALPAGWTEITPAEFARSIFFQYSPKATAWSRTAEGDARMFFMHNDTGFALIGDYHGQSIRIFKFGCQHDFDGVEVGRCLTRYTCKKCGFVETVDSSD